VNDIVFVELWCRLRLMSEAGMELESEALPCAALLLDQGERRTWSQELRRRTNPLRTHSALRQPFGAEVSLGAARLTSPATTG
jgi:hypothetical protein